MSPTARLFTFARPAVLAAVAAVALASAAAPASTTASSAPLRAAAPAAVGTGYPASRPVTTRASTAAMAAARSAGPSATSPSNTASPTSAGSSAGAGVPTPGPATTARSGAGTTVPATTSASTTASTGSAAVVESVAAGDRPVLGDGRVSAARVAAARNRQGTACGGSPLMKADGTYWACSFDDEFSGSTVDTTKWSAFDSIKGGFRGGDECYNHNNATVSGGELHLTVTKAAAAFTCGDGHVTQYNSGLLLSRGKFSQTYGRFEMRAKFPAGVGFQPAFWMLPANPFHTSGYSYGEIDVAEAWGTYPGTVSPHLHYVATPSPQNGAYCSVPTSASAFHTYTVEWTRTTMTFLYDGRTCWKTTWSPIAKYQPAGATAPTPFDQDFYMIVNLATGGDSTPSNRITSSTKLPSQMEVDYIRAWR